MNTQTQHPPADHLAAFALGKLPDTQLAAVAARLDACPACAARVKAQSADGFAAKLRHPDKASTDGGGHTGLSQMVRSLTDYPAATGVPAELTALTQYADFKELGRGGMGVVYLARNTLLNRPEVLKVTQLGGGGERFQREMEAVARLRNDYVAAAYAAYPQGDRLVFAMEYCPGEDLKKLIERKGKLAVPAACFYAYCAAKGLQHAHELGLAHRDIKPGNLILTRSPQGKPVVRVLDFGLVKLPAEGGERLTGGGLMGTPAYMAPEQAANPAAADTRADVYSLGCTLYHLLAGQPPFAHRRGLLDLLEAHKQEEPPPLADAPPELAAVVAKMLAKRPEDRYQTPGEVAAALKGFVTGKPTPAAETHQGGPTLASPPRRKRWGAKVWAMLAIGLALNVIGGLMLSQIVFKTPNGTIVVEGVPADATVELDGATATVTRAGESVSLTAVPGKHSLKVVQGGKELRLAGEAVVVVGGQEVRVRVEPPAPGPPKPNLPVSPPPLPPKSDAPLSSPSTPVERPPPPTALSPVKPPAPPLTDDGFTPLFNGRDTTGWEVLRDGHKSVRWRVEDGCLIGTHATDIRDSHGTIQTATADFGDFRLRCQVKVSGRSSVLSFRDRPAVGDKKGLGYGVVLCGTRPLVGKSTVDEVGGSLCRLEGRDLTDPLAAAKPGAWKDGEWNELEVAAEGPRLRVWVNAVEVVDHTDPRPLRDPGRVSLLYRARSEVAVRDLRVRRLGPPAAPSPEVDFTPLFNGRDLTGWKVEHSPGDKPWWAIADGTLVGTKPAGERFYSIVLADGEYADFTLRFDFRLDTPRSEGAVCLRATDGEKAPMVMRKVQERHPRLLLGALHQSPSHVGLPVFLDALNSGAAPIGTPAVEAGRWHAVEVVMHGDICTATLDGVPFVGLTPAAARPGAKAGPFTPGLLRKSGRVGFEVSSGAVGFRNVRVGRRDGLPPPPRPAPPTKPPPPEPADPDQMTPVVSRFAADTEGWVTARYNDGDHRPAEVRAAGAGGWLFADRGAAGPGTSPSWGWHAPRKFLGDHSDKFGTVLTYRLWADKPVAGKAARDAVCVQLVGDGLMLVAREQMVGRMTASGWKEFRVPLDRRGGWKDKNGGQASDDDIRRVLAKLNRLFIDMGHLGVMSGGLDDVVLGADK